MKVQLTGRIESQDFYNGNYTTVIATPAPDAYSQPSSYKIRSSNQLGSVKSEITVWVEISGFVKDKPYKDRQTGENKIFQEANVFFEVCEAPAATKSTPKAVNG